MDSSPCVTLGGRGIPRSVVLGAPAMVGFQRRDGGCRTVALAGRNSFRGWFRGSAPLRMGFRLDRARNPGPGRPTEAPRYRGFLPACEKSNVRRIRNRLDWFVDCVRASEPGGDWYSRGRRDWGPYLCCAL